MSNTINYIKYDIYIVKSHIFCIKNTFVFNNITKYFIQNWIYVTCLSFSSVSCENGVAETKRNPRLIFVDITVKDWVCA